MKKLNLSLVAVLAMSTFAIAGGDIAPVEPVVEAPYVEESTGNFYIGGAYAWQQVKIEDRVDGFKYVDDNFGGIMIDAGYKFNPYIAVEGRYTFGLSSSNTLGWRSDVPSDITIDSWAVYVKPMYPVSDAIDVYALLGYGAADITFDEAVGSYTTDSLDGFSWGLGMAFGMTENVDLFVDYTSIIRTEDMNGPQGYPLKGSVDNVNFGINYNF